MQNQNIIKSNVAMVLDDMPIAHVTRERAIASVKRTIAWAKICKEEHHEPAQMVFGIGQGSIFSDLREKCLQGILPLDFDGYAIGGLAIGENQHAMYEMITVSKKIIPREKPVYFMGLGSPLDLLKAIGHGIDMFDSAYVTQVARRNSLFTRKGIVYMKRGAHALDFSPIEEGCQCFTCRNYTRAYVHRMSKLDEHTGMLLKTIHNIHFILRMFEEAKVAIKEGRYAAYCKDFEEQWKSG